MADASGTKRDAAVRQLEITRRFDAPPEVVFKAWTDAEQVRQWWGPNGFSTPVARIDLRPGGTWQYCMRSPEGQDFWCKGTYREVVPNRRIVSTDSFCDEAGNPVSPTRYGMSAEWPAEMLVTVTFDDDGGHTRLSVRQSVDEALARHSGAVQGWNETLDRLARHVGHPAAGCPMAAEPQPQHGWLRKLVGAWSFEGEGGAGEGEGGAGEGQPAQKFTGTETVRGMGGLWVVAEGEGAMPDGGTMTSLMTLGYDPQQGAYVGTFVASMMTHLWVYRGAVDDDGRRLVLCTEGPDMENGGKGMTAFEDSIAIEDPDHRTLTSRMRGADGQWRQVFKARYTRLPG